jgi:cardiolipin synthase
MDYFGPHVFGYFIALLHSLGLIAAIHAVLTVRTAQGSIAWALSLLFMPYLTLIPYLVFGRSSFDGYIKARRQANEEMRKAVSELNWRPWVEEALTARASSAYASLRAMPKLGRMPCLANNEVRLLVNGQATFEAIFHAIDQAREAVLVQFFIIHDDRLGRRLRDLLLHKADGGVKVKAFATRSGWLNRFQVNFRNHRKIVVVDGMLGFVGGHNVGDEYMGEKPPLAPWRDTHVQVRGPVVACMQESFAEDWFWAARELPPLILPQVYPDDGVLCQVLASGPADAYETCSLFFVEAIHASTERVWITSPYFIPDEAVLAALRLAVLRGVDVRILLPSRPDHRIVYAASSLYAFEAVRAGVRVFRYQPGFLHQKVVLIDSEISAIGSANMDNRSFRLNFEVMLLTVDKAFAAQVEQMLNDDFDQAHEIAKEEGRETRRLQQIGMRVARLISPIL